MFFLFFTFHFCCSTDLREISYPLIKRLLPQAPTIIEAGAHYGEDTYRMASIWPDGAIYAFEPLPSSYQKLFQRVGSVTNVNCFPYALSNCKGTLSFYEVGVNDGSSSLLFPQHQSAFSAIKPWIVTAIRLDDWCIQQKIDHVDFLWFDMEGNELNALKGAEKILKTVSFVYTEINFKQFWVGTVLYPELKSWLEDHGFCEVWMRAIPGAQGNALFAKK